MWVQSQILITYVQSKMALLHLMKVLLCFANGDIYSFCDKLLYTLCVYRHNVQYITISVIHNVFAYIYIYACIYTSITGHHILVNISSY